MQKMTSEMRVLIVDDDKKICDLIKEEIGVPGRTIFCAHELEEGLRIAQNGAVDLVFLDIRMPDGNGLEYLRKFREAPGGPEVIIMTGSSEADSAETALNNGAWDYIQKPAPLSAFTLATARALEYRSARMSVAAPVVLKREKIIGESREIVSCLEMVARSAASDSAVLITGETGTGKELLAHAIHENSRRSGGKFVIVDCSALPENLIESTLFGHEKGSFTGADRAREGLFLNANGGTLFLDEIGELPPSVQRTFLRVLQERRFRPIGGKAEVCSDFRLIAATNRDLREMTKSGQFRSDLLFRITSLWIHLPPLRERKEDIKDITLYCLRNLAERYGTEVKGLSPEFFECLLSFDWPGNVRQLINTIDRAYVMAGREPVLFPQHLPVELRLDLLRKSLVERDESVSSGVDLYPNLLEFRKKMDSDYLAGLMRKTGGDIDAACSISGLSRSHLYALLKSHKLTNIGNRKSEIPDAPSELSDE
ncbi:MAG TPA: sigma-54 dependent transcriptional regulator [Syntrophales bacterium]|nr:sigma-54 dependent transcriptional regulator [Syntrophales bacterium]